MFDLKVFMEAGDCLNQIEVVKIYHRTHEEDHRVQVTIRAITRRICMKIMIMITKMNKIIRILLKDYLKSSKNSWEGRWTMTSKWSIIGPSLILIQGLKGYKREHMKEKSMSMLKRLLLIRGFRTTSPDFYLRDELQRNKEKPWG